jgi:acetyl-CoA synthetase
MENARTRRDGCGNKRPREVSIKSMEEYAALYKRSLEDVEGFWAEQARTYLSWEKEWDFVLNYDFETPRIEWFGKGVLNASYNGVDRHLDTRKNVVAYHWEGDDPHERSNITFLELYRKVNKLAAVLQAKGVRKGDRVTIVMPMIPELPIAMLACARLGAVHCVVFSGYGPEAIASRIGDCRPKAVLTADGGWRSGRFVPVLLRVKEALRLCPDVETVIVYDRCGTRPMLDDPREVWWHEAISDPSLPDYVRPEPMEAEDPLFILHTSGSSGKPLAIVHTHGGYLLHAAMSTRLVFDLKDNETLWSTSDIGWITGHTYAVYGPLVNGLTSVLYEGSPTYPGYDRYWQIVERYRVDKLYTVPTVIRRLAAAGPEHVMRHDLSSLKLLGSAGQPLDPAAWQWFHHHVGQDRCPIVDTWWQTESGGHMIAPLPGIGLIKPGSCSFPFFGVEPVIIDPDTGDETRFPNQEGALFIKRPWPGMARTVFEDHERFRELYFSRYPGMFFTGDGVRRDEDGYLWITRRIDEVINVGGCRVGPAEVESALVAHPLVAEVAVVSFPHPIKGDGIYAFVALRNGFTGSETLEDELQDLVKRCISPMAIPDAIQWVDGLPKTRSGKVLRQLLQKIAAGDLERLGDMIPIVADPSMVDRLISDRQRPHA